MVTNDNNIKKWIVIWIFFAMLICFHDKSYEASSEDVKVSIIVPVYQVEPWIEDCMDSLVNQTLKEIEIICIDDGSTDQSRKILDRYAKEDDRIIVIHQENRGVSNARNVGIDLSRGEYITFVDPDDYIELDTYEYTYNIAKANDDDVLEFGVTVVKDNGKKSRNDKKVIVLELGWILPTHDRQIQIEEPTDLNRLIYNYVVWNKLYKSSMIKQNRIKFIPDMVYEDNSFTLMMVPHMKKYESIEKKFYYYRRREGSITTQGRKYKGLHNCIKAIPAVCEEWRKTELLKGNEEYILSTLMKKFFWALEPSLKSGELTASYVIDSFGNDVYNDEILGKCDQLTKRIAKKLESYLPKSLQSP